MLIAGIFLPSTHPPTHPPTYSPTDFIPPIADVLSTGWSLPAELLVEINAGEGAVEVETEHKCVPGQGCALLRHYSKPAA